MIQELLIGAGALSGLEIASYLSVRFCRERFQWLITKARDSLPEMNRKELEEKYFGKGFDPELGWTRQPKTSGNDEIFGYLGEGKWGYKKTTWTINSRGARTNPGCEAFDASAISCYGDSFAFSRQVNDNETWAHQLSRRTKLNVLNFGVGNYGLDQAILRMEREFPKNPTRIVVMAVVPDTISRVLSYWKHFSEYGNCWAFKPRFELENGKLKLIPNAMDAPEKFFELENHMGELGKHDYFYANKFAKELIGFPYSLRLLRNPVRNLKIMSGVLAHSVSRHFSEKARSAKPFDWPVMGAVRRANLEWTARLYEDKGAAELLERLVERFAEDGKRMGFEPVFVFLPQKNEALYQKHEKKFYTPFMERIKDKVAVIDITSRLENHRALDSLYSEHTVYGAHYNPQGNIMISDEIYYGLKRKGLVQ